MEQRNNNHIVRDSNGRFANGSRAHLGYRNPRAKNSVNNRAIVDEVYTDERMRAVLTLLLQEALGRPAVLGDPKRGIPYVPAVPPSIDAAKEVLNRKYGKAPQQIDMSLTSALTELTPVQRMRLLEESDEQRHN
jgi:hypothetical protein